MEAGVSLSFGHILPFLISWPDPLDIRCTSFICKLFTFHSSPLTLLSHYWNQNLTGMVFWRSSTKIPHFFFIWQKHGRHTFLHLIGQYTKNLGVVMVWQFDLQLPVQSVPITTKIVSLNAIHGEVYLIQLYVIKFFNDLLQVCGVLRVLRLPPPIIHDCHDITEILLKVALNTMTPKNYLLWNYFAN